MRSDGQNAEAALRHGSTHREATRQSRKKALAMQPLRCNRVTQTEVYPFRGATGCAKLLGFRRVLQFTVGLRIVICVLAARSGRAAGGREQGEPRAVGRENQNEEVLCLGIQSGPRSS